MTDSMKENGKVNNAAGDFKVDGRHGNMGMVVGEAFERGWRHATFRSW